MAIRMTAHSLDALIGGFKMEVIVGKKLLRVYKVEHDENGRWSKGYIPSEVGREYAVRLTYGLQPPEYTHYGSKSSSGTSKIYPALRITFELDGNFVEAYDLEDFDPLDEVGDLSYHVIVDVPGIGAGAAKRYCMIFARPALTEDAKHLDEAIVATLSTIVAKFRRIRYLSGNKDARSSTSTGGRSKSKGKKQDIESDCEESEYDPEVPDHLQGTQKKKGTRDRKGKSKVEAKGRKTRGKHGGRVEGPDTSDEDMEEDEDEEDEELFDSEDEEEDEDEDDEEVLRSFDGCCPRQIREVNEQDKKAGLGCLTAFGPAKNEKKQTTSRGNGKGKGKISGSSKSRGSKSSGYQSSKLSDSRHEVHPDDVDNPFYTLSLTYMTKDMLIAKDIIPGRKIILEEKAGDTADLALNVDEWNPVFEEQEHDSSSDESDSDEDKDDEADLKPTVKIEEGKGSLKRRHSTPTTEQRKRSKASSSASKSVKVEQDGPKASHHPSALDPNIQRKRRKRKGFKESNSSGEERDRKQGIIDEANRRMAKQLNKQAKKDGRMVNID